MNRLFFAALAAGLVLFACKGAPADGTVATTPQGPGLPVDHPPVDLASQLSTQTGRLTLPQLRASLPVLLGNDAAGKPISWTVGQAEGLTAFASTLGEADWLVVTEDNVEPSPVYLKFLDDAARDVCNKALVADSGRAAAASRVLLRHVEKGDTVASNPTAVDRNLRYLKLRFHGVKVADADTASLDGYRALFAKVSAAGTEAAVREGWRAVCVALITSPELNFY